MPASGSAPAKLFCSAPRLRTALVAWTTPLRINTPAALLTHSPKQDNNLNALRKFKSMSWWFSLLVDP
eukprot:6438409-Amphidinium_carterae.1